jgi:hypothetical protein
VTEEPINPKSLDYKAGFMAGMQWEADNQVLTVAESPSGKLPRIDKNIPQPAFGARGVRKYPFSDMEVGDSFSLPRIERLKVKEAAKGYGRRSGRKLRVATTNDEVRCWRVE